MDPSLTEEIKMLALQDMENEYSEVIQLALSNTVVIREIFKFLPASTLKSCSLVNKLWRNECYSYCRDKMKWVAKISEESPCASLRNFNELIGSMPLVPYNGLILHVDQEKCSYSCQCKSPEDLFTNVLDKLTWRHLDILIDFEGTRTIPRNLHESKPIPCAAVRLGMTLLEQKIAGLESLKFWLFDDLQPLFNSNWPPAMPNLKAICFPQTRQRHFIFRNTARKGFFTRLTNAAPNLKEINGWTTYDTLKCFAEEKWRFVKDFIDFPRLDDEMIIAQQFVSERPALRNLILECVPQDDNIIDDLLEMSQMTLEHLELAGMFKADSPLHMIALPPLPKLRFLKLHMLSNFGYAIEKAWSLLNQHFCNGYPQLEEFHLSVDINFGRFRQLLPGPDLLDQRDRHEELLGLPNEPLASVSKLQLELDPASSNFVQLHRLFPTVTDLRIICEHGGAHSRFPYKQIFRLWQNLDRITICYYNGRESPYSLDAAFCGLHEEEVEWLEKEDDTFLMAAQLVPIAPCVLTMRNMVSFTVALRYVRADEQGKHLTRVARMLASRYLPKAEVNVP